MNALPLAGRVALVTGANSGIGRVTATELALRGAHVFLACRSEEKTRSVLADIAARSGGIARAEFLPLDLGDLDSVRRCVKAFLARGLPLHLLVNNAGLAAHTGLSASGFELTFGVCHVGHFALTSMLLDRLKDSAPARVVVVASRWHRRTRGIDFDAVRQPTRRGGLGAYATAKLANVLFASELGRRLQGTGVTTYSLHPGVVATEVWRALPWPIGPVIKRFMLSPQEGANDDPVLRDVAGLCRRDRSLLRSMPARAAIACSARSAAGKPALEREPGVDPCMTVRHLRDGAANPHD